MSGNAIIWDFDGTLVDSRQKNLIINRKIIAHITGKPADSFPLLRSQEQFEAADEWSGNWRDFYMNDFGLSKEQTEEAGRLWTEFQLGNKTPMPFFSGISDVLSELEHLPQGIVSQNSKAMIEATLSGAGLDRYITAIIGYEEVTNEQQKPDPAGLLECLEQLTSLQSGTVFYVGDWQTDTQQAVNTRVELERRNLDIRLYSVGAFWGKQTNADKWSIQPDYRAKRPQEIVEIVAEVLNQ